MDIGILVFGVIICSFLAWHLLVAQDDLTICERFKNLKCNKSESKNTDRTKKNPPSYICLILLFIFNITQIFFIFQEGRSYVNEFGIELYSYLLTISIFIALAWWMYCFKDFNQMNHNKKFFLLYIGFSFIATYMTASNLDFLPGRIKYLFNLFILALPILVGHEISSRKVKKDNTQELSEAKKKENL